MTCRERVRVRWFGPRAGSVSEARMLAVDAEIRKLGRRRAIEITPVSEEWVTAVI